MAPLPDLRRGDVIEAVRVIDVIGATSGSPMLILIENGIIIAIGEQAPAAGLVRVEGRGRFLVPGFWDMHVNSFQHSPQTNFPLFGATGVTNVRDMLDCPGTGDSLIACVSDKRRWSAEAEAGRLSAPRIIEVASYYLEEPTLAPAGVERHISV
ncbi:MAG TPA: hypothetical protein VEZ48_00940 [Sphingomonadaceae bacterium]|nr:hypothetical protein [Sphingomonadaceae bacterium]